MLSKDEQIYQSLCVCVQDSVYGVLNYARCTKTLLAGHKGEIQTENYQSMAQE